jgi:excisionase family DNA binding protein
MVPQAQRPQSRLLLNLSGKDPDRLLTVADAAEILKVHPNTIRVWSRHGLLPAYRIGRRRDRRFLLKDVESLVSHESRK